MSGRMAKRKDPLRVLLMQARPAGGRSSGQGIAPPLGLMSIAAEARERMPGRHIFSLLDSYDHSDDAIAEHLYEFAPHVGAISLDGGRAHIDGACKGCGRCAAACPAGAISLHLAEDVDVEARLLARIARRTAIEAGD